MRASLRQSVAIVPAACAWLIVGCGGIAVIDATPGEPGETTSTPTTSTTSTEPTCLEMVSHGRVALEVYTHDGEAWGCDAPAGSALGRLSLEGVIADSGPEGYTLDSCPPGTGCQPMESQLRLVEPDWLPVGLLVRVLVAVEQPGPCVHRVEIWNLPSWRGMANPELNEPWLLVAAADGNLAPISELPYYSLTKVALGCFPGVPSCGEPKDYFHLRFTSRLEPADYVDVPMGDGVSWHLPLAAGGPSLCNIGNLRAYESGACDDHWNYAYRVACAPPGFGSFP